MWVTCMLHNWCLGVCPQYGSWFSLPILAGAPCCSPCFPHTPLFLLPLDFPHLLHPITSIFFGWGLLDLFLFLFTLQAGVAFVSMVPSVSIFPELGWESLLKWMASLNTWCFQSLSSLLSLPICTTHCCLLGPFLSLPAPPFILVLGLVRYSPCFLAVCCWEQLCLG